MTSKWLKIRVKQWWQWVRWPVMISLVAGISLSWSVKSYLTSVNRQELMIAVNTPGSVTINPFNLTGFTQEGKLKVYGVGADNLGVRFVYSNQIYDYQFSQVNPIETVFAVKPNETISLTVARVSDLFKPFGWVPPTDPYSGICPGFVNPIVAAAQGRGELIVSVECWNDDDQGDDAYDDFGIVITQVPGASSSPSSSPNSSPSSSPSSGCSATAPSGLTVTQGSSNTQAIFSWYQGTKGNQQLIKIGSNQAEVLSGCYSPSTCVYNSSSPAYSRPADPNPAQQLWFFTTEAANGAAAHTCVETLGNGIDGGYTSIQACEDNININVAGWVGKTSGVCYLSQAICGQNSFGNLTVDGLTPGQTYYYRIVNYFDDICKPEAMVSFTQTAGSSLPSPSTSVSPSPSTSVSPNPSVSPNSSASPSSSTSPAASFPPTQPDTGTPTWLTFGSIGLGVFLLMAKLIFKF